MVRSFVACALAFLLVSVAAAQGWKAPYEAGLRNAQEGKWPEARDAFRAAVVIRSEDQSGPTGIPGPATEQRNWRNGAPYSPNFLAAYSAYRLGLASGGDEASALLRTAATEFEALIGKGQYSRETFFFLDQIYTKLNDTAAREKLQSSVQVALPALTWRVDTEPISPEERAEIALAYRNATTMPLIKPGPGSTIVKPGPGTQYNPDKPIVAPAIGKVQALDGKYALIVGNTESRIEGGVPFALENVAVIKDALLQNGGYSEDKVIVLANATTEQILSAAQSLADRVKEKDTVFIYFAGMGFNLDGKDYLAGVNTTMPTDTSTMAAKFEVFKPFMAKGAHVFAYFEANRPVVNGAYFGMEVPVLGVSSQTFATLRGEQVYSTVRDGKTVGVFADALAGVLQDLKSNRVPVVEFGWQVFYKMSRGGSGTLGGSSRQTPTLPMLNNMATNARF